MRGRQQLYEDHKVQGSNISDASCRGSRQEVVMKKRKGTAVLFIIPFLLFFYCSG